MQTSAGCAEGYIELIMLRFAVHLKCLRWQRKTFANFFLIVRFLRGQKSTRERVSSFQLRSILITSVETTGFLRERRILFEEFLVRADSSMSLNKVPRVRR